MAADDTQTQTPTPPPDDATTAALKIMQQFMPQPVQMDTTPVKRSWQSLLGEGLGGGETIPMSPADKEAAGVRALGQFGTQLMAASRYSPGQTFASNLAAGFEGAQRGLDRSIRADVRPGCSARSRTGGPQQQELRIKALREALPLLTLQQQAQQAKAAIGLADGDHLPHQAARRRRATATKAASPALRWPRQEPALIRRRHRPVHRRHMAGFRGGQPGSVQSHDAGTDHGRKELTQPLAQFSAPRRSPGWRRGTPESWTWAASRQPGRCSALRTMSAPDRRRPSRQHRTVRRFATTSAPRRYEPTRSWAR